MRADSVFEHGNKQNRKQLSTREGYHGSGARQETEEVLEYASSVLVLVLVYAVSNITNTNIAR